MSEVAYRNAKDLTGVSMAEVPTLRSSETWLPPRRRYRRRRRAHLAPRAVGGTRLARRRSCTGHRAVRLGLQPGPEGNGPVLAAVRHRLRDAPSGRDPVGFAATVAGGLGADRRRVARRGRPSGQRTSGPGRCRRHRDPRTATPDRRQGHRTDRCRNLVDRVRGDPFRSGRATWYLALGRLRRSGAGGRCGRPPRLRRPVLAEVLPSDNPDRSARPGLLRVLGHPPLSRARTERLAEVIGGSRDPASMLLEVGTASGLG